MPNPPKWEELEINVQREFLLEDKIKLASWYIDGSKEERKQFSPEDIDVFHTRIKNRETNYYGITDTWLYESFDLCSIQDKTVAVMGSIVPWYEIIVLEFGGKPTTIEYTLPNYKHPQIEEVLLADYWKSPKQFDVGLSISSFEHDGLGRYGDPINPSGDLRAMSEMKQIIKKNGFLFLAVPVGMDKVVWNAHRVYGNIRLPMLLKDWEVVGCVGMDQDHFHIDTGLGGGVCQPIIVLRNI